MFEDQTTDRDGSCTLCCLFEGSDDLILVEVPFDAKVRDLQMAIHAAAPIVLEKIRASGLRLWKVDIDLRIRGISLGDLKVDGKAEKIHQWDNVSDHWPKQPPLESLQVVVKVIEKESFFKTIQGTAEKRVALEPAQGMFDRLNRAKTVKTSPSETGKPAVYQGLQWQPSERIFDDRPQPDEDFPPISLLYAGYGHFLDIMNDHDDVPGLADVDIKTLWREVDNLASKMLEFWENEDQRRDVALPILNRIFSARGGTVISPLSPASIGSINSDGITAIHGSGTAVVVFKNWLAGIDALPQIEVAGYIAHLSATGMNEDARRALYERWRVPFIGITIVGCAITFYAILSIDHRFRLVSLTPTLSCIPSASEGADRKSLYAAFTAASVLQAQILQDTKNELDNPVAQTPESARRLPYVSKLRSYPPSSHDYFAFELKKILHDKQPYCLLYAAETSVRDKRPILIKFSRRYSIELHAFCAERGHAPKILGYERLPGGWYAVAMQYIESAVPITRSDSFPQYGEKWISELRDLVGAFHTQGLVHGDLRDVNILCKGDSVMLIDFDWGGKEGEVFYPSPDLHDELLQGREFYDLKIRKEDDVRVLENTLSKFRSG